MLPQTPVVNGRGSQSTRGKSMAALGLILNPFVVLVPLVETSLVVNLSLKGCGESKEDPSASSLWDRREVGMDGVSGGCQKGTLSPAGQGSTRVGQKQQEGLW